MTGYYYGAHSYYHMNVCDLTSIGTVLILVNTINKYSGNEVCDIVITTHCIKKKSIELKKFEGKKVH